MALNKYLLNQIFPYLFAIAVIIPLKAKPQNANNSTNKGYTKNYLFLHSADLTADKNFYLLTVIDQDNEIKSILKHDQNLKLVLGERISIIKKHATDTCQTPVSLLTDFKWGKKDSITIVKAIKALYSSHKNSFDRMINKHLRPSGYYQRFCNMPNEDLLLHAWDQYMYGTNYIVDQFGLGRKMRYTSIDSASYPVNSDHYKTVLKDIFASLDEKTSGMQLFYDPSLNIVTQLMDANDRDEPSRAELLELKENRNALKRIKHINWKKYPYATILLPGYGPILTTTPISPEGKIRCDIAARRYLSHQAPFIITSGGFVYPFRGPFCEAIEMKRYLMEKYSIPANAIIVEAQARHTTTNFRNANRLIIRSGIPINKPSLFTTSKSQNDFVAEESFDTRNMTELKYLPYRNKKRISNNDIVYYPTLESLHIDPLDPLDP
jgi:hypothetical protein